MQTEVEDATKRGLVVSDLHLFARRSQGAALFESLRDKLAAADCVVLNGDIFDFRWSALRDRPMTVTAALDWLATFVNSHPRCLVHYVLGNHDCLIAFRQGLTALASTLPRFQWHESQLCLGSALFLHGDCADATMDAPGLKSRRARWEQGGQRGILAASAYAVADRLGLTRRVHEWHFPRHKSVQRVSHYLDRAHPGWRHNVRDCYFGHTHLPFSNYQHAGVTFHNTGSAMPVPGMGFNPLTFKIIVHDGLPEATTDAR